MQLISAAIVKSDKILSFVQNLEYQIDKHVCLFFQIDENHSSAGLHITNCTLNDFT